VGQEDQPVVGNNDVEKEEKLVSTSCRDCGWQKDGPRPSMAGDEYLCTSPEHCKNEIRDDQFLKEEFAKLGGLWLLDWAEAGLEGDCPHFRGN